MSRHNTIGKHKTVVYFNGEYTCVKYHYTDVVKFKPSEIILNSGGWRTNTTKVRMNQTSNQFGLGFQVYQKNWEWYVDYNGETMEFFDGMKIERG